MNLNQKELLFQEIEILKNQQKEEYLKAQQRYLEYQRKIQYKTQQLEELMRPAQKIKRAVPFQLYKDAPTLKTLLAFEMRGWRSIPYYSGGNFDVKELAEMIKQIYQFEKNEEYEILVMGLLDQQIEIKHKDILHKEEKIVVVPKLYVLVGKKKLISRFEEFNGHFITSNQFASIRSIVENAHGKDLVILSINKTEKLNEALDLECVTGSIEDKQGYMNYFDSVENMHCSCLFNKYQQIIISDLSQLKINGRHHFRYNKDLLNFEVYQDDRFIGDILTSICIYKKSNKLWNLTSDDYNHIFETLYKKSVDIINLAQRDFPKSLEYKEDYTRKL